MNVSITTAPFGCALDTQTAKQYHQQLIVAALRDPYELGMLPGVDTCVCAFSFRPSAAQAMADVLCGEHQATGKTPMTIPNTEFSANAAIRDSETA